MFFTEVKNRPSFKLVLDKSSAKNGKVDIFVDVNEIICRVTISDDDNQIDLLLNEGDVDKIRDILYKASHEMALERMAAIGEAL